MQSLEIGNCGKEEENAAESRPPVMVVQSLQHAQRVPLTGDVSPLSNTLPLCPLHEVGFPPHADALDPDCEGLKQRYVVCAVPGDDSAVGREAEPVWCRV